MAAVAASPRLAVEVEVGADIIADIGDRDDRPETALVAGLLVGDGPDGIVMVARVDRVDGDDRQVTQIFQPLRSERHLRPLLRLRERFGAQHLRNLVPRARNHAPPTWRQATPATVDQLSIPSLPPPPR